MSTSNAFGGGSASSKKRLVADLASSYKNDLNPVLKETAALTERIAAAVRGSATGNSNTGTSSMSGASQPPINKSVGGPNLNTGSPIDAATNIGDFSRNAPSARDLGFSGSSSMTFSRVASATRGAAATIMAAGAVAIASDDFIMNDIARRRYGFYGGTYGEKGANFGARNIQSMMNAGTPISTLDAAQATMAGNSMGLMNGLSNYGTISSSVAGLSNVMPGVGLVGGMNAVAALNQGSSINKLRMIGIQVRDNKGFMRGVEDIAKDVWSQLNKIRSGSKAISTEDLSYSLQPGMSLDMMLNQYFNGDPVLREGIVAYLYQFASGKGTGTAGLNATGANPKITTAIGQRQAAEYRLLNSFTTPGIEGITFVDNSLTTMAKSLSEVDGTARALVDTFVKFQTGLQTLTGAANGAAGLILGNLTKAAADFGANNVVQNILSGTVVVGTGLVAQNALEHFFRDSNQHQWNDPNQLLQPRPDSNNNTPNAPYGGPYAPPSDTVTQTFKSTNTAAGWAKSFLQKMGIDNPTAAKINVVKQWLMHENKSDSGYLGLRNNPLNVKYDWLGTSLGQDSYGMSVFKTEDEGIRNTIRALGQQGYGFPAIVEAFQAKDFNPNEAWARISASQWSGGHYIDQTNPKDYKIYYSGNTFHINITGVEGMDPKELADAIRNALDNPRTN